MKLSTPMRLRTLLLLAALLPVLLVSALLTWPVVELRRTQLMEQARLRTLQAGRASELLIAERLGFAKALIGLLADRPALTGALVSGDAEALRTFVSQTRDSTLFDVVTIVSPDGVVLAQDGNPALWRANGGSGGGLWVRGEPGIGIIAQASAPIRVDGMPGGTIVGTYVVDQSFVAGARQRSDLDQALFVGGTLVISSLRERERAGSTPLLPLAESESLADNADEREATVGGVPYLVHYQPIETHDDQHVGAVEVLLPLAPVRAAQQQTTLTILGGVLVAVLTAALLSWLLAQRITRSIRRLGRAAAQIGAGELRTPVAVRGPKELVELSAAIDQMRTQLRYTHAALADETARYVNILEATGDAILVLDSAGNVTLMNRGAEQLLGRPWRDVAGAPLRAAVRLHGDEALSPERIPLTGGCHLAIQVADGRVLTVAATRAQVRAKDAPGPGEQIVVLRDVTDTVALTALKDAFLANVTHEFRTPLAALIASLEILRDEHGALSPDEQQQMFGALQVGVRRLDTLVQNLLDSASIQAGYFRVKPEVTRLEPLVDEALDLIAPLVRHREQAVGVSLAPDLPPIVADDRRLVQVLVNLLSNASKFGPRGDILRVEAWAEGGQVAVTVADHGPGIPDSRQGSLFQRFLRPGSETIGAQGAGLGLAIVKAIVEAHGGTIVLQEASERGTTFRFTVPAVVGEAPVRERAYATTTG